jgi:hypothetical protein
VWDPGNDPAYWRVYHQDYQNPTPLHRKTYGPTARFDHHASTSTGEPREDPNQRSTIYVGVTQATALAEVFWDQEPDPADASVGKRIARVCPRHRIAQIRPRAPVKLLSLLDDGCDEVGALPELCTGPTEDHIVTQQWAGAIYEDLSPQGLCYVGAHQLGKCIVLWDNSPDLEVVEAGETRDWSLHEPGVWERVSAEYETRSRAMLKISTTQCPRCRSLGLL